MDFWNRLFGKKAALSVQLPSKVTTAPEERVEPTLSSAAEGPKVYVERLEGGATTVAKPCGDTDLGRSEEIPPDPKKEIRPAGDRQTKKAKNIGYTAFQRYDDAATAKRVYQALKDSKSPFPFQVPYEIAHMAAPVVGHCIAARLQMETEQDESERVVRQFAAWFTASCGESFGGKCQAADFPVTIEMLATGLVGSGGILDSFGNISTRRLPDKEVEPEPRPVETVAVVISPNTGERAEAMTLFDAIERAGKSSPLPFDLVVAEGPKLYMTVLICFFDSSKGTPKPKGSIYDGFVPWLKTAAAPHTWYALESYGPTTYPPGTHLSLEGYWGGIQILRHKRISS